MSNDEFYALCEVVREHPLECRCKDCERFMDEMECRLEQPQEEEEEEEETNSLPLGAF